MTGKKEVDVDLERKILLKVIRTAVRARHAVAADRELHDLLPKVQAEFDKSVLRGELLDPSDFARFLDADAS